MVDPGYKQECIHRGILKKLAEHEYPGDRGAAAQFVVVSLISVCSILTSYIYVGQNGSVC